MYKRLLFSPGMYRSEGSEEDFAYLKNYGRRLSEDLEENFDCHVHIHKGSAFLMTGEECRMGNAFPANNILSDIILLSLAKIRERIETGTWQAGADEICRVDIVIFEEMLKELKHQYESGFSKNYRTMPDGEFVKTVMEEMEKWMFIRIEEKEHQVKVYPAAGKLQGHYPENYAGGKKDE